MCKGDVDVYAFEPVPILYKALKENAEKANPRIRAYDYGLWNKEDHGTGVFYPNCTLWSGNAISGNTEGVDETDLQNTVKFSEENLHRKLTEEELEKIHFTIRREPFSFRLSTLHNFIQNHNIQKIDLLKIDAEKSEYEVLLGLTDDDWKKSNKLSWKSIFPADT